MQDIIKKARDRAMEESTAAELPLSDESMALIQKGIEALLLELNVIGFDEKYGAVFSEHGSPAHDGEPCFVIRGRDLRAQQVVKAYGQDAHRDGASVDTIAQIQTSHQHIREWQMQNGDLVHQAD